jgi:hypothetical protein
MTIQSAGQPTWKESHLMQLIFGYSIVVALLFSFIFVVAKIFHLENRVELRYINYILLFPISFSALYRSERKYSYHISYFRGFLVTYLICVLGQFLYSILFFIYIHIDHAFLIQLTKKFPSDLLYPEMSVAFILITEGIAFGSIVALTTIQYFKREKGN